MWTAKPLVLPNQNHKDAIILREKGKGFGGLSSWEIFVSKTTSIHNFKKNFGDSKNPWIVFGVLCVDKPFLRFAKIDWLADKEGNILIDNLMFGGERLNLIGLAMRSFQNVTNWFLNENY